MKKTGPTKPEKLLQLLQGGEPAKPLKTTSDITRKRKLSSRPDQHPAKKPRSDEPETMQVNSLGKPHEAIVAELAPKYDILGASVISSSKIQKRITYIAKHLLEHHQKPRICLLYARTAEVCKLITIVEQCCRVLREEGKSCHQYNQLFDLPEEDVRKKRVDVVEETILPGHKDEEEDSDDSYFEVTARFEKALLPPPSTRKVKSLRVFLSLVPVPELKSKHGVTVQSSEAGKV